MRFKGNRIKRGLLAVGVIGAALSISGCFASQQDLDPIRSDISVLEKQFMEVQRGYAKAKYDEEGRGSKDTAEKLAETNNRLADMEKRLGSLEASVNQLKLSQAPVAPQPMAPEPVIIEPSQGGAPGSGISAEPKAPEPTKGMIAAEEMFNLAQNAYVSNDLEKAEKGFNDFIATYPDDRLADDARFFLGEINFTKKDFKGALEQYERVVKEHPLADRVPDALFRAGQAEEELADPARARDFYNRVIDNYPYSEAAKKARQKLDSLK